MLDKLTNMLESNDDITGGVPTDEIPEGLESEQELASDGGAEGAQREDVEELAVRLGELEEDLDRNESSIRAVRSSQEGMEETVEEINETVRQLLGVYDQLTADANPFTDGRERDDQLIENPDASEANTQANARTNGHAGTAGDNTMDDSHEHDDRAANRRSNGGGQVDDETVSFDDLVDESGNGFERGSELDDAPESDTSATETSGAVGDGGDHPSSTDALLSALPEGYAGEMLIMEWLAALMERSGPAGALRAVDHYEDLGWIDHDIRERLVDTLGGPGLDAHVDPNRPSEPTASDHEASHVYVRTLDRLHDL